MAVISRLQFISTLCLLLLASTCYSFAVRSSCGDRDHLCGPECMLVVCQRFGVNTSLDELTSLSGCDRKKGTNLMGLFAAAKAKGLEAVGMKIGVDQLAVLKTPAIAHLWENHFVVAEPGNSGKLNVLDPPAEPKAVAIEDFQKVYSGFALLIAKDKSLFPKSEARGADLRVEAYTWDFGAAEEGNQLQHTFICRNEGSEDLLISKIDSTCGCTVASVSQDRISPGAKAEIKAMLDTTGRSGAQAQTIYIHSNDPITPVVQLQVVGVVQPSRLIYSPRSVSFGDVRHGQNPSRMIVLPISEARQFEIEKASSDISYLTTVIATSEDKRGYLIKLNLRPEDLPLGEVKGKVTIYTNHPKDPKVEIPVTATIKGNIEVFPNTLFLGMLKQGAGARKKITISTVSDQPFKILKIDNPVSSLLVRFSSKVDGKEYVLTGTLLTNTPAGYIKNEIVVHTDDPKQPEIKIPVYALVEN